MIEQLSAVHPLLPPVVGSMALLLVAVLADLVAKRLLLALVRSAIVMQLNYVFTTVYRNL